MIKKTDGAEDAQDLNLGEDEQETADTNQDESLDANKPSPEPKLTKEQRQMVDDRVAAILAKKGDRAKTLEDQVKTLTTEIQAMKDEKFANKASEYSLSVDDLKSVGITEVSQIESYAKLFGKEAKPIVESASQAEISPKPQKVDSGKTAGGTSPSFQDEERDYIAGKKTEAEYREARKKHGLSY